MSQSPYLSQLFISQPFLQRAKESYFFLREAVRALAHGETRAFVPEEVSVVSGSYHSVASEFNTDVPQGSVVEEQLQDADGRNWRAYFVGKLAGRGLEISPSQIPMLKHSGMEMDYIDRKIAAELRINSSESPDSLTLDREAIGNVNDTDSAAGAQYDFLISSHVIEYMPNPLLSLRKWARAVKPSGLIYLVVSDKRSTANTQRVRTMLEHIILDYQQPSLERDFEHYLDHATRVQNKKGVQAIARAKRLVENDYNIHYHTFLPSDMKSLIEWFSVNIRPLQIVEGPCMAPADDEFHFLLRVV